MTSRMGLQGTRVSTRKRRGAADSLLLPFLEVKPPEEEAACSQIGVNRHPVLA